MEVVAGMSDKLPLADVAAYARRVEALGYDTLHVPETVHDSLAGALLALQATTRITVRTSVTLAFIRSPMLVALSAWDLAGLSAGRFELGLGSQIRANIEDRYGMAWSEPTARMRDFVEAVRAAWAAFRTGEAPHHRGEHYRLTRLQPFFTPGPIGADDPPLWLGGVNAGMVELAGEVAAGLVTHPTNSHPRYLAEQCRPALERGRSRRADGITPRVIAGGPVVTGPDAAAVTTAREHQRRSLAFLYSTPAYARTLELIGRAHLGPDLRAALRSGDDAALTRLVDDDLLDEIVPCAPWSSLATVLADRYRGLADGVLLRPPDDPGDDAAFASVVAALRPA